MEEPKPLWLNEISPRIGHYLAGFADGEGSFVVSLRKKADHAKVWQITTTFNVSQKERHILAYFKRYLRCGRLQERDDGVAYFVVENRRALWENVIPFFTQFPFLSMRKQRNFKIFKEVVALLNAGAEKNPEGFMKIVRLREQLNEGKGRTRKYGIADIESENPQRLYAESRLESGKI